MHQPAPSHIVPAVSQITPPTVTIAPAPTTTGKSLSDFQQEYLSHLSHSKSAHYLRSVSLSFKQFRAFTGEITLAEISHRIAEQFIIQTFSRTNRGAALYYRTLKAAFNVALNWEYIPVNPFKKVKLPKIASSHPTFLTIDQLEAILEKTASPIFRDVFTFAFYTGMRAGEIVNARWSWVNFHQNTITVKCANGFTSKSKKERIIPISARLQHIIAGGREKSPEAFIFSDKHALQLRTENISKQFKKALRAAGMNESIHFHTLRHSFASNLVQKGVQLYVVKELLGHEDLKTTQIYSHLQHSNLTDAVNLL